MWCRGDEGETFLDKICSRDMEAVYVKNGPTVLVRKW